MTTRKTILRTLALGATAVLALAPQRAVSGSCAEPAARNLLASSYLDSVLNPPEGEDREFLYKEGGLPNIMFLFDTSASMRRLPPNGPAFIGGLNPTLPPGVLLSDPNNNAQQIAAWTANRVVGCGLDWVSRFTPGFMTSDVLAGIQARTFHTPCGSAANPALVGAAYQGETTDYAAQMTVCPRFMSNNNQATGYSGFDPDFYDPADPTALRSSGTKPNFFGKDLVFHDTTHDAGTYGFSNALQFRHNFGDGWTETDVYPYRSSANQFGTINSFCNAQGNTLQGWQTRDEICRTCLRQRGWYYDGIILDATQDGIANKRYPSIWYTGNYLNFFPPKFLIARKVVKDILAVQSKVRMAFARFDAGDATARPPVLPGATVFEEFKPVCGAQEGASYDSARASDIPMLNDSTKLPFNGTAPLSRALYDIGRFYHSPDLPWFSEPSTEPQGTNKVSPSNKNQYAVCSSCQASTVILLTDGIPAVNEGSDLPAGTTTVDTSNSGKYAGDPSTGILGIDCPKCGDFTGTEDYLNNLPRVAWYLNNMDLRRDEEDTEDCNRMGDKQVIETYTIGFGTGQLPSANTLLRNTATAGGGVFVGAEDASQLKEGIEFILREISTRSTSFSVATISTLQTTSGRAVIVPRFDPNKSAFWRGHLFRYDLYSEFVNLCTPDGPGDLDCDGRCTSAFLVDNSGSDKDSILVSEGASGAFVRNKPAAAPLCSQAPKCQAAGKTCAVVGNEPAVAFWDAGKELANQGWKTRNVWTVVDGGAKDGRIDASDPMVKLTTSTDAAAEAILPYLATGTSAAGMSVCAEVATALLNAGDIASATHVFGSKVECAKTVIRYLLGADVLNSKAKKAPDWPPSSQEDLWDRDWKLGDIFHSSPVVVDPPLPRDGILCPSGLSNQCLSSLWGTPTKDGEEGYDAYSKSTQYKDRRKIVLVGANDGLLHAFNGGKWKGNPTPGRHNDSADDPFTSAVDESLPPFNGYYERGTEEGAKELWAFLPPDLISKIPSLMGSRHHYFVDGTAMVRDVWVDGTSNAVGNGTRDDRKQGGEFHTVAVIGERRGGTHYFALDITDATEFDTRPTFLWIYPQPNDPETLRFGETYDDFLPTPPPVGPVRIAADADDPRVPNVTPEMTVAGSASGVAYHERWIAFLSKGFDPQYLRGRGVQMVDVWTGERIFDFSYPLNPASATAGDPRLALRFPVAATIGMVPWGQSAKRSSDEKNDRFFDTATFGDTGGQLWVVRFNVPGTRGANGLVDNWFGARIFQMGGRTGCTLCGAQPFFYITANMPLPSNLAYRVFAGTGDRYNLLDKNGGTCGPDNIRACVMRGCTVDLALANNYAAAPDVGYAFRGLYQAACNATQTSGADGTVNACAVAGRARIAITGCPGNLATTKDVEVICTERDDGYRCEQTRAAYGAKLAISDTTAPINVGNWYLSLLVFEDTGDRAIFDTLDEAKKYDAARLWIQQSGAATRDASPGIVMISAKDDAPTTLADADSKGWALYYDHGPTITIDTHQYTVSWKDERTSSSSAVGEGLITWNATQPAVAPVVRTDPGCKVSKCTAENRRVAYHYGADPETGAPYKGFQVDGSVVRSIASYLMVPTQADQPTVFVNQKGQVAIGLTAVNPEKGASNVGMGDPVDPTTDLGYVEVSPELHACRHADTPVCK